jgi:hypothetical protein
MKQSQKIFLLLLIFSSLSHADIINVPTDIDSIQGGINLAGSRDTVLVAEGTYYENINFKGKAITVASQYIMDGDTSHISNTIIDGSQHTKPDSGSVVYFISGEDTTSVLCGFTITGGSGTFIPKYNASGGGGILMTSGGMIIHNRIMNNTMEASNLLVGAGLLVLIENKSDDVIISHNEFKYNSSITHVIAASCGGGIYCKWKPVNGYLRITKNLISYNSVTNTSRYKAIAGGLGVAFDLPTAVDAVIDNNIILNNEVHSTASMGAGLYIVYWEPGGKVIDTHPTPLILNNIIANNYSDNRGAGIGIWTVENLHQSSSVITPQPAIINNTIVNNKAKDGSGIFNFDSYPLLLNNIVWNDLSVEGSREIFNDDIFYPDYTEANGGELNIYYTDIQGGWAGDGNIDAYPAFADSTNYYLSDISPCIDAGFSNNLFNDIENGGNPVWPAMGSARNDMGAYGGPSIYNQEDLVGIYSLLDSPELVTTIPLNFQLFQNYPNPFNPKTVIRYALPVSSHINLSIYNLLGQKVATLVDKKQPVGSYQVQWDASGFASGVYFYRLNAGNFKEVKKMILLQ